MMICYDNIFDVDAVNVNRIYYMREWLSGGAPPCQGGGRGFDPRLALFYFYRFMGDCALRNLFYFIRLQCQKV